VPPTSSLQPQSRASSFLKTLPGHVAPVYQPETKYEIYRRFLHDLDIDTGKESTQCKDDSDTYSSKGAPDACGVKDKLPPMPQPICYLLSLVATCTPAHEQLVKSSKVQIENYIVS
jgi:carboxypeptidase D